MISSMNRVIASPRSGSKMIFAVLNPISRKKSIKVSIVSAFQYRVRMKKRPEIGAHNPPIFRPESVRTWARQTCKKRGNTFIQVHPKRWPLMLEGAAGQNRYEYPTRKIPTCTYPTANHLPWSNHQTCEKTSQPFRAEAWPSLSCPIKTSVEYRSMTDRSTKNGVQNYRK